MVAPIEDKFKEIRLRWFGYIYYYWRPTNAIGKNSVEIIFNGNAMRRGRAKLTWDVVVRNDMNLLNAT